jgi:hypothetical protein
MTSKRAAGVASLLIAAVSIGIFYVVHPLQRISFIPAMLAAAMIHFRTTHRRMPDPERVLPIYLIALALQLVHFAEEYVYGFATRVTEISPGMPPFDADVFVVFNMIAYALFVLGALAIYRGIRFPMVIVWFFALAVIGNAIGHALLCIRVQGYFPGFYTSLGGWIVGPILIRRLLAAPATHASRRSI